MDVVSADTNSFWFAVVGHDTSAEAKVALANLADHKACNSMLLVDGDRKASGRDVVGTACEAGFDAM